MNFFFLILELAVLVILVIIVKSVCSLLDSALNFFSDCKHNFVGSQEYFLGKKCDPLGTLTTSLDARPEIQILNASY